MLLLKTFGGLSLVAPDGMVPAAAATQRRRLALLAVIAAAGETGITREKLLALFWPDTEETRARAALAQALYALKQGLGPDEVVLGTTTLRLNEAALASDVGLFRKAVAERRWADAALQWTGPFLDGVVVPGLGEFDRWADAERGVLTREAMEVFERLGREATASGDAAAAVRWWQKRVAADPLAAAGALGLMEALEAAGDRAAALVHARLYETLVRDQLEMPPDPAVVALAERLRTEPAQAPPAKPSAPAPAAADPSLPDGAVFVSAETAEYLAVRRQRKERPALRRGWLAVAGTVAVIVAVSGYLFLRPAGAADPRPGAGVSGAQVIAVGAFGAIGEELAPAARALTDMLATNLAQAPGLNVVSSSRIYELTPASAADTARALMTAARAAGATDLVEGSVYQVEGGVRLDLRRITLATGEVAHAVSVTARDLFAAVDSGTARLLERLGRTAPVRPLSDVTTTSLLAYRLYEEGLRSLFAGQNQAAYRFFTSALEHDSTFAMAAYYAAQSGEWSGPTYYDRLARAVRLAPHAGDRERLLIQWTWADQQDDPSRVALAETLVTRWASEPFAHLHYARAVAAAGRFAEANASMRRAIALDRGRPETTAGRCIGCEARGELAALLRGLDSLEAAERVARELVRVDPSHHAYHALAEALLARGRVDEALEAIDRAGAAGPAYDVALNRAIYGIRAGRFELANEELLRRMRSPELRDRLDAGWWLHFAWRAQGRLADAMEVARTLRATDSTWGQRGAAPYIGTAMAAVLYEQGRYRQAAALWDSIAVLRTPGLINSRYARHRAWFLSLAATAHAAAGDTAGLGTRADTIEVLGRQSSFVRDQRLHHHVRGLLYQARGRHEEAVEAFRAAVHMPTVGYGRNRVALARSLVTLGRHDEAVAALRPLLAGPIDGSNTYLSLTEVRAELAEVFAAAGRADSAAAHAARVVEAWRQADPLFEARRRRMEDIVAGSAPRRAP